MSSAIRPPFTCLRLSPSVYLYAIGTEPPCGLPTGSIALPTTSSAAFGDGSHPTTRLCAGAVDLLCRQRRPRAVLDVGTGTGVLARIARARGAQFVAATDIDPVALSAARANAALDRDARGELIISDTAPDAWGARFDLVVANILEAPLRELAPRLVRALAPGGELLLSGFTALQVPGLDLAFATAGVEARGEATLEGWTLRRFGRRDAAN